MATPRLSTQHCNESMHGAANSGCAPQPWPEPERHEILNCIALVHFEFLGRLRGAGVCQFPTDSVIGFREPRNVRLGGASQKWKTIFIDFVGQFCATKMGSIFVRPRYTKVGYKIGGFCKNNHKAGITSTAHKSEKILKIQFCRPVL